MPPRLPPPRLSRLTPLSWDDIDSGAVALLPVDSCIPAFAQDTSCLVGHVFVQHEKHADDDIMFKIIERISSDLKGTSFEVQFMECEGETMIIPQSDLLEMVGQSSISWEN